MNIGLILLLSVLALALIMMLSSAYFIFFMKRLVFRRLQELDHVRSTGLAPERWRKKYLSPKMQKRKNLWMLKGLLRYTKTTRLVEDEDVRKGVILELCQIREAWTEEV